MRTKRRKLRSRRFVGEENVYREETSELLRMHGCANKRRHFAANKWKQKPTVVYYTCKLAIIGRAQTIDRYRLPSARGEFPLKIIHFLADSPPCPPIFYLSLREIQLPASDWRIGYCGNTQIMLWPANFSCLLDIHTPWNLTTAYPTRYLQFENRRTTLCVYGERNRPDVTIGRGSCQLDGWKENMIDVNVC